MQNCDFIHLLLRNALTALTALCVFGTAACGSDQSEPGYVPDPELYVADSDPAMIREFPNEPGAFAFVDEVLLIPADGSRETADRLALDVQGEVVGQIKSIGLYQLKVPSTNVSELEAVIETLAADPSVKSATENPVAEFYGCPVERDVTKLTYPDSCPYSESRHLQLLTTLEGSDTTSDLNPVRIAVVDSGLAVRNGEFDDATIFDVKQPGGVATSLVDAVGHGTSVASLIAADNDGNAIDGIASILGPKLTLLVSKTKLFPHPENGALVPNGASLIAGIQRAVDADPRVVNISAGITRSSDMESVQEHFFLLFEANPDTLFVVAAGNEDREITEFNAAPAGIVLDNVITVGSTLPCSPESRVIGHAWGSPVEIAAQGREVPVVDKDGNFALVGGTSFSSPQVAAAAGLILAVDPSLTPVDVKYRLIDDALPGPAQVGGKSLNIARPVHRLLQSRGGELAALIDADEDGDPDAAGLVAARVCLESEYTIDGVGTFRYSKDETNDLFTLGTIAEEGISLSLMREESDLFGLTCADCAFDLADFEVTGSFNSPAIPESMPRIGTISGELVGTWSFRDCVIEQRYGVVPDPRRMRSGFPDPGMPQNIRVTSEVSGQFTGARVDGYDLDGEPIISEITGGFSGRFSTGFVSGVPSEDSPIAQTLETVCANGRLN